MKDCEAFERRRQVYEFKGVSPNDDLIGVSPGAAVQSRQLQRTSDNPGGRIPIFEIKEYQPLTKKLSFVLGFNL